jgi:hypothetical protein
MLPPLGVLTERHGRRQVTARALARQRVSFASRSSAASTVCRYAWCLRGQGPPGLAIVPRGAASRGRFPDPRADGQPVSRRLLRPDGDHGEGPTVLLPCRVEDPSARACRAGTHPGHTHKEPQPRCALTMEPLLGEQGVHCGVLGSRRPVGSGRRCVPSVSETGPHLAPADD